MRFPFITRRAEESQDSHRRYRRKGGGGKGSGKGASGGSTGSSSRGSSSSVTIAGSSRSATSYGSGGGKASTIPSGQIFAGRTEGGGTRDQVFGSSTYGSGYPGITGRGVAGRGFPFLFWPIVWGGAAGIGSTAYLHDTEYGSPDNTSRPGGPMMTSVFVSSASTSSNSTLSPTTFHILADNTTLISLISAITTNCSSNINTSSSSSNTSNPSPYNASDPNAPQPESAIGYYRASSVVLTLNGYNNSAALSSDENATNTPLPTGIDTTLEDCLNQTIGAAVPLVDSARSVNTGVGSVVLLSILFVVLQRLVV
ncbi:hypothetical protein C8J55DRAFT_539019 [Lentinula edodes]|uniref:Uncharacterized protein n=1 Tax=Lentinula lateritia TaxID=40482 RepID=A0A9W8ZR76_9AGAR|nr:hypothetical protein C8J55DRAFT_539019 [Lentinula edodes]